MRASQNPTKSALCALDPAPRSHEKFIVSYAKSFPGIENRPDTPHQPAWGGSRDPKVDSKMWSAE